MGGGGRRNSGGGSSSSSSSSGEEDGDADWRAAIDSVATSTTFGRTTTDALASTCNGSTTKSIGRATQRDEVTDHKQQNVKHYQIKAQKLLDEILEKTTEIVTDPIPILNGDHKTDEGGVRLFKNAPPEIVFDHIGYLASLVIT